MNQKVPKTAFQEYVDMGPTRNYVAIAMRYGVTSRAVRKRAARERWQERVADFENAELIAAREAQIKMYELRGQESAQALEEMNRRHISIARFMQYQALAQMGVAVRSSSWLQAARLLALGVMLERHVRLGSSLGSVTVPSHDVPGNGVETTPAALGAPLVSAVPESPQS